MGGAVAGIIGGVVQGAGSLFGADAAATASENATRAQTAANQQAQQMNWLMYQQGRQDTAPWRSAGYGALNELSQLYGLGTVAPSGQATLEGMPAMPDVQYDSGGGMWDALSTFGDPAGVLPDFMDPAGIMADKARARSSSSGGGQTVPVAGSQVAASTGTPSIAGGLTARDKKAEKEIYKRWSAGEFPGMTAKQAIAQLYAQPVAQPQQATAPVPVAQAAPVVSREQAQQEALSRFMTSPGYSFRLNEGIKALDRSAAARGRLMSGAQYKGVQRFGEGLAANEYESYTNRLAALAGLGQTSSGQSASLAQSAGQVGSGIAMQGGADRASGYINQANAWNQGIQGVGNAFNSALQNYQQQQYMQQLQNRMQG